jgi:hypothetical protein
MAANAVQCSACNAIQCNAGNYGETKCTVTHLSALATLHHGASNFTGIAFIAIFIYNGNHKQIFFERAGVPRVRAGWSAFFGCDLKV